ncbi:MAG TPA: alcohol dehydrogenase catalytic domain-containing protein [Longimicrobiales bacterium]|nr:alcohol dehydrogenase catalytic domain-containing protein [Longimicrobiales bacterium]
MEIRTSALDRWIAAVGGAALWLVLPIAAEAQSSAIRQWQYVAGPGGQGCELGLVDVPRSEAGPGDIQVRIHAASLNGRDRYALQGNCRPGGPGGQVALSDGAGEVIAVGAGVSRFEVGDRVVLDIGGEDTRLRALEALSNGGHMALIGGLRGFGGAIPVSTSSTRTRRSPPYTSALEPTSSA